MKRNDENEEEKSVKREYEGSEMMGVRRSKV
jgi:hypothetical protein